jgi:hypothetical protein
MHWSIRTCPVCDTERKRTNPNAAVSVPISLERMVQAGGVRNYSHSFGVAAPNLRVDLQAGGTQGPAAKTETAPMFKNLIKRFAVLGLVAAAVTMTVATDANAGARQCWRGVGGWYCN